MLRIVLDVDVNRVAAQGAKEAIAVDLEKYGDVRVVEVTESIPEQIKIKMKGNAV